MWKFNCLTGLALLAACAPSAGPQAPANDSEPAKETAGEAGAGEQTSPSEERPGEANRAAVKGTGTNPSEGDSASAKADPLPLPADTKVLHVGDSFAGALGRPLGVLFEEAGMRSVLKHTDSSYLTDWAWDGNLQKYIWKYNPDLILVTLGANELEIAKPEQREKTIKKIVSTIGDVPCVWVAIPLWEGPKNGLLEVIKKHSAPCVYMDTNELFDTSKMERIKDGIHPTTSAREKWAKDVLVWLQAARKPTEERAWNVR